MKLAQSSSDLTACRQTLERNRTNSAAPPEEVLKLDLKVADLTATLSDRDATIANLTAELEALQNSAKTISLLEEQLKVERKAKETCFKQEVECNASPKPEEKPRSQWFLRHYLMLAVTMTTVACSLFCWRWL